MATTPKTAPDRPPRPLPPSLLLFPQITRARQVNKAGVTNLIASALIRTRSAALADLSQNRPVVTSVPGRSGGSGRSGRRTFPDTA